MMQGAADGAGTEGQRHVTGGGDEMRPGFDWCVGACKLMGVAPPCWRRIEDRGKGRIEIQNGINEKCLPFPLDVAGAPTGDETSSILGLEAFAVAAIVASHCLVADNNETEIPLSKGEQRHVGDVGRRCGTKSQVRALLTRADLK